MTSAPIGGDGEWNRTQPCALSIQGQLPASARSICRSRPLRMARAHPRQQGPLASRSDRTRGQRLGRTDRITPRAGTGKQRLPHGQGGRVPMPGRGLALFGGQCPPVVIAWPCSASRSGKATSLSRRASAACASSTSVVGRTPAGTKRPAVLGLAGLVLLATRRRDELCGRPPGRRQPASRSSSVVLRGIHGSGALRGGSQLLLHGK